MENDIFFMRLEAGLNFFDKFITYPDGKLTRELNYIYPAVHDYILFLQGLQIPFYSNLRARLREHDCITQMFEHFLDKQSCVKAFLMPDEAYDFLLSIKTIFGSDLIKSILEIYNKIPYKFFSHTLKALNNNENKQDFVEAIENINSTELMKALWLLRFVLYGVIKVDDKLLVPLGLAPSFYAPSNFFFRDYQKYYDNENIEINIKTFLDNIYNYNNYDLFGPNKLLFYYSFDSDGELKEIDICKFKKNIDQMIDFHSEHFPLNKRDFVSSTFSNEFQSTNYCKYFIFNALYSHKKLFYEILDKSYIHKMDLIYDDFYHSEIDFHDITFESYIYKHLMKISMTYNVVKNFLNPKHNGYLLQIFDRFPVFKEAITGVNSLYNKYFENVFGTELVDVTNKTSNKDNYTHNSEQMENGKTPLLKDDRRSPFIMNILNKKGNFDKLFREVLHHLYLYLTADEAQESIVGLQKNKKAYIDSDEADFISILGGKLNYGEKVNENPTINWIGYQKAYYAFVYSYFGGDVKDSDSLYKVLKNGVDPGKAPFTYCFLCNNIHRKLSELKERDEKEEYILRKRWMDRFEKICNHVMKKEQ